MGAPEIPGETYQRHVDVLPHEGLAVAFTKRIVRTSVRSDFHVRLLALILCWRSLGYHTEDVFNIVGIADFGIVIVGRHFALSMERIQILAQPQNNARQNDPQTSKK
jgi:hypothetical protein